MHTYLCTYATCSVVQTPLSLRVCREPTFCRVCCFRLISTTASVCSEVRFCFQEVRRARVRLLLLRVLFFHGIGHAPLQQACIRTTCMSTLGKLNIAHISNTPYEYYCRLCSLAEHRSLDTTVCLCQYRQN